jgi:hypothetical protein
MSRRPTGFRALRKRWRRSLVRAPRGRRFAWPAGRLFIPSPPSMPGLRARSDRWSGQRLKLAASHNLKTKTRRHDPSLQDLFVRTGPTWSFNVKKHSNSLPDSHRISSPPLFEWRHVVVRSSASRGAQFIMRRYRVEPHVAETIAMLAGLGVGEER